MISSPAQAKLEGKGERGKKKGSKLQKCPQRELLYG